MIIDFSKSYLITTSDTSETTAHDINFIDKDNINPSSIKLILKSDSFTQNIDLILQDDKWIIPNQTAVSYIGECNIRLIITLDSASHATNTLKITIKEAVKAASFSMRKLSARSLSAAAINTPSTLSVQSTSVTTPTEPLELIVDNRNIILSKGSLTDVIVQNDSNSKFIKITINRYYDGIDLSTKEADIKWVNSKKLGKVVTIPSNNITVNANDIELIWTPDGTATAEDGILKFVAQFIDTNKTDDYIWQTKIFSIEVQNGLVISQYATTYDYATEKAWLTVNPTSATYNMIDGDPSIKITDRDILVPDDFRFVCKGDNESEIVTFVMDRYYEGIDLSTKTVTIKYINANGEGDRVLACNVSYDSDFIYFGWLVTNTATVESGKIKFSIELIDYDATTDIFFAWNTHPAELTVEEGLIVDKGIMATNASFIQQASVALNNIALYGATKAQVTSTVDEMINILGGGNNS